MFTAFFSAFFARKIRSDNLLAPTVLWMGFAGKNNLEGPDIFRDSSQAIKVAQDQVSALIARCAASKTNGECLGVEFQSGLLRTASRRSFLASRCAAQTSSGGKPKAPRKL